MKRILIIDTTDLKKYNFSRGHRALYEANLAIIKTDTHFRCIKNRWESPNESDAIPLNFLKNYVLRYENFLSKEELIDTIIALS